MPDVSARVPTLSVVVPIFNEVDTVPELHRRLTTALAEVGEYELVLVDDRSSDGSWEVLVDVASRDPHVRVVRLSRNFGHQIALSAGLDAARGDAVVFMDGDLQDPPEVIPQLLAKWHEGYDVVYAVREHREGETRFKRGTAKLFYRLMKRMSQVDIPEDAGDFRLLSRRAADAVRRMPERARYLRGMTSWIGFRQTGVPYRRDARTAGETKYPLRKMVKFAIDATLSFSTAPLRFVSTLGLAMVVFCFAYLVYSAVRFATGHTVVGWTSLVILLLLIGGIQLLSLGVVGQYVARIFEESKGRPLYVVDEIVEAPPLVAQDVEGQAVDSHA
jgi:dolichol-phosphate mannosyltransferase